MAEAFDPYYKWLGIPPKDQPPNHYRLLAIEAFEPDIEVIDTAANRQMAFVQEFSTGPHLAASQKLLNEIAAARIKLLNKQSKAEYDRELRARLTTEAASSAEDNSATPPAGVPVVQAGDTDAEPFVSIDLAGTGKGAKPARGPAASGGSRPLPKGKKLSKSAAGRPATKGKESSLAQRRKSNELSPQTKMIFGAIFVLAVCGVGALAYQMSRPKAEPVSTPKFASPATPASPTTPLPTTPLPTTPLPTTPLPTTLPKTTPLPTTVALPKATPPAAPAKSPFLDRASPAQATTKSPATKKPPTTAKTPAKTRKTAKSAAKTAEDERNAQVAKYLEAVNAARAKADADKKAASEKKAAEAAKAKSNESPEQPASGAAPKSSSDPPADKPAETSGKPSS